MHDAAASIAVGLDDKPAAPVAAFIGLQHLLAVLGGIVTAPLLIALGMGLPVADTTYLISSALVVSGFATLLQISRVGPVGSGLLSVQGTSFSFVGPLIYVYQLQAGSNTPGDILGMIFTACLVCSVLMMGLSLFIERLRNVITADVAGATVILIGLSLVWTTLNNIRFEYAGAVAAGAPGWPVLVMAGTVFLVIVALSRQSNAMLRMSCIVVGLAAGFFIAALLGQIDNTSLAAVPRWFFPELGRYPLSLDLSVVFILLPIFVISATESVGDLTATSSLSGLSVSDRDYFRRLRGGVLADSINSAAAALFSTFPNTTFSQNNGVIRITGVCSRRIGLYVAGYLVLIGMLPIVAAAVQLLPGAVVAGATLLMFIMVGLSGLHIVREHASGRRGHYIVGGALAGGLLLAWIGPRLSFLPDAVINIISFPVSSGAFIAMLLQIALPRQRREAAS